MTQMNKGTIERLFRRHYQRMYQLAMVLLKDDAASKDVVSDVFFAAETSNMHLPRCIFAYICTFESARLEYLPVAVASTAGKFSP